MPEFDLDSFKKSWQEQEVKEKYDNNEILKMLNKKSRSYVKYILWISLLEFVMFLSITLYYVFWGDEETGLLNILNTLGVEKTAELNAEYEHMYFAMKVLTLLITGFFVIRFYNKYRKINIEANLKALINKIISFKSTVKAFIISNIALLILYIVILTYFVFATLSSQNIHLNTSTLVGFCIGILITVLLSILLMWLYYKMVYGLLIKRLNKNLAQLQEIEKEA